MIFSDLFTAFLTLVLVVLFYTGKAQIWHIYVIMAGRAAGGAFQFPALRAAIPMIVEDKHLVRANGLFMTLRGSVDIVAPMAGAFLMASLDIQWVLAIDIITAAIAIGTLLPLVIPHPVSPIPLVKRNYMEDIKQSYRYIISWRGLTYLVVLAALINFLSAPVNALLPLFVTRHLGGDVIKLGWLETAMGIGIIAGGLILGAWGGFKRRAVSSFTSFLVWSAAIVVFGLTTQKLFYLALALMVTGGLTNAMGNAPFGAIFQSVIARDMQGRFHSLYGSLIGAMAPIGLAIAGPVSNAIGLRAIWIISGATIFLLFTLALFSREIMSIEDRKQEKPNAEIAAPEMATPEAEN